MLAPLLGHRFSRIVATIVLASMYACASDSQQSEEIVESQVEDSAASANLGGDDSKSILSAIGETSTQSSAEESTPAIDDEVNPEETSVSTSSAAEGIISSTVAETVTDSGSAAEGSSQPTESVVSSSSANDVSAANQLDSVLSPLISKSEAQSESASDVSGTEKSENGVQNDYTVKKGDTLSQISLAIYGRAGRWKKIADHNKLANPDLIFPGQKLLIPKVSDKTDQTALTAPTKTDPSLKNKTVKTRASGKLGASKKAGNAQTDTATSQKSEQPPAKIDDPSVPAERNAAGVVWEKQGDYSQVRPDGFATITWKPGFSVRKIAEVMFGDSEQWSKVLEFNNLDSSDENRIKVGQRINFKVPVNPSQYPASH